jgi:tRNA(fMet)-specific endonuclease VapC
MNTAKLFKNGKSQTVRLPKEFKSAAVLERLTALSFADIGISAVTLAELEYGVAKISRPQQNRIAFNGFLAPIEIAPFDARATAHYGEIWCLLEKRGKVIGAMDLLIAAHAVSLSVTLVTNNLREFKRIPDLQVENWI